MKQTCIDWIRQRFSHSISKNSSGLNLAALQSNIPAVCELQLQIPSYFQPHTVITVHIWMQSLSPKKANGLGKNEGTVNIFSCVLKSWQIESAMISDVKGRKMKAHFFSVLFECPCAYWQHECEHHYFLIADTRQQDALLGKSRILKLTGSLST